MTQVSFTEKVQFETRDFVIIYRGHDKYRRKFFAYVLCNAEGLAKMRHDYKRKRPDEIGVYGKVIYIDYIANPDNKAKNFLEAFLENYDSIKDLI